MPSPLRVACVAGARPNFMKIKPVLDALEERGQETVFVHTGQHYDPAMSDVFLAELGIRSPDHHLDVRSGTQAEVVGRVMVAFERLLDRVPVDVIVVVGDVNSTLACAIVGAKAGCLVAHVEAGLRSRDWRMPEEVNRVATDRLSDYLFAPSSDAVHNLRAEGYRPDQVHLVGNVMVDTLLANVERARSTDALERLGLVEGGYGVVTLHRPSNVDDADHLGRLLQALGEIATDLPLVFPVHPRTAAQLPADLPAGLVVTAPAGYLEFVALQAGARVVITDSGGVQEETTVLGVPCLTVRDTTERPITVSDGTNRVIGTDPARLPAEVRCTLEDPPPPRCPPLWDGQAARRISDVIASGGTAEQRHRPTDL